MSGDIGEEFFGALYDTPVESEARYNLYQSRLATERRRAEKMPLVDGGLG